MFIAVGTPARRGDGHADLTFVFEAVRELAKVMKPGTVVVTKSTVPVGTGDQIEAILKEEGVTGVSVASNPEFLREGAAIADFKHPDRIVVGAEDEQAEEVLKEIYRPLFLNRAPILITGRRTAELTKYAANAFLAVKISFINEIANLCEAVDADVQDVARGIGLDNRIGPKFLHAGPGYGGSCFPKDTLRCSRPPRRRRRPADRSDDGAGERRPQGGDGRAGSAGARRRGAAASGSACSASRSSRTPTTCAKRRRSRSFTGLIERGATVRAFDPVAREQAEKVLPGVEFAKDAYAAADGADALVIVTEWDEFRALDLDRIAASLRGKVLVDLRNVYDRSEAEAAGLIYYGIGRGRPRARRTELIVNRFGSIISETDRPFISARMELGGRDRRHRTWLCRPSARGCARAASSTRSASTSTRTASPSCARAATVPARSMSMRSRPAHSS